LTVYYVDGLVFLPLYGEAATGIPVAAVEALKTRAGGEQDAWVQMQA